ncbi:hypothetical protein EIP91_011645 [Steccherinum ochraceum]|uniref:F-box domain-containing protein n=1 Tax=Steccherinum ochraceum TaxID=92696 RepID=A0A4R0RY75_9APHY|nr:hypothetical protein EIP91_011645 [Steccherinum ochraceum]
MEELTQSTRELGISAAPSKSDVLTVSLPRELIDMIFGFLDKPSLIICTLLSHSWHVSAQPYIFHTLTVKDDADEDSEISLEAFQLELQGHFCLRSVTYHTQHLSILGLPPGGEAGHVTILQAFEVLIMLQYLPKLRILQLKDIMIWQSPTHVPCPPPFPLDELILDGLGTDLRNPNVIPGKELDAPSSIVELLNLFGPVRKLTISECDTVRSRDDDTRGFSPEDLNVPQAQAMAKWLAPTFRVREAFVSKRQLSLHEPFMHLLKSGGALEGLETMETDEAMETASVFLEGIGHTLSHLHLTLDHYGPTEGEKYDLSSCSSLTSLHVTAILNSRNSFGTFALQAQMLLHAILHSPPTTRRFTLEFYDDYHEFHTVFDEALNTVNNNEKIHWAALDRELAVKRQNVEVVDVVFRWMQRPHEHVEGVEQPAKYFMSKFMIRLIVRLPKLHTKKLLRWSFAAKDDPIETFP